MPECFVFEAGAGPATVESDSSIRRGMSRVFGMGRALCQVTLDEVAYMMADERARGTAPTPIAVSVRPDDFETLKSQAQARVDGKLAELSAKIHGASHGPPTAAGRLENAKRMIDEGRITPKQARELLAEADLAAGDAVEDAMKRADAKIRGLERDIAESAKEGGDIMARLAGGGCPGTLRLGGATLHCTLPNGHPPPTCEFETGDGNPGTLNVLAVGAKRCSCGTALRWGACPKCAKAEVDMRQALADSGVKTYEELSAMAEAAHPAPVYGLSPIVKMSRKDLEALYPPHRGLDSPVTGKPYVDAMGVNSVARGDHAWEPDSRGFCHRCGEGSSNIAHQASFREREAKAEFLDGAAKAVEVESKSAAKRFSDALDKALPPSMAPRPGEQCKVCGEKVPPRKSDDGFYGVGAPEGLPNPVGWMLAAFPYKGGMQKGEWLYLCPKCGKRCAEYISYMAQHQHARDGE